MENESTNNADYEGGSSYDEYCEGGGSFRRAGVAAMLAGVLIFDTIIGVSMYRDHQQDKEIQQARIEWDKEDNDRNCNLDDIAKLADESLFGLEQLQKDDPKEKTYKKITVGMGIGDYIDSYDHMLNNTETIGSIIEGYGWKFDTDSFEDTWSKKYPMYSFLGYMNNMPADLLNIVSAEDKDKIAIEISELATKYDTESADLEKILDKAVVGSIVDKVGDCDVDIDKMADALHGMATLNSSTFINRLSIERDFDIYIKHIES
ncbi:hypothetical protein KDA11_06030, partial [Candidatus Saccharibacteria bacterium]|nr:hypothetical protein [Candidatus Saccharibacteria bacterium]